MTAETANGTLARIEALLREIADLGTDIREIRAWTLSHEREDRDFQGTIRQTLEYVKTREATHWEGVDKRVTTLESEIRTHRYLGISTGVLVLIAQALGIQIPKQ